MRCRHSAAAAEQSLYHLCVLEQVQDHIHRRGLLRAGDRVAVAVSGGADSVALLRALAELRTKLGVVLAVAHFHHGIRGPAADEDARFVTALAKELALELHMGQGDVPAHARQTGATLETAARELRYQFFAGLLNAGKVDRVATAHTMDDQAETVLMRLLRGAGTRGLAGIYAAKDEGKIIRPLLGVRREEVIAYLNLLRQDWREDESNRDTKHFRNQVRHELLPWLKREFNPGVVQALARTANIAHGEEEYWAVEMARLLPLVLLPGKPARGGGRKTSTTAPSLGMSMDSLGKYPLAVQRRLLRAAARTVQLELDADHVERLLELVRDKGKSVELPAGWQAVRSFRELRLEPSAAAKDPGQSYALPLPVPGEVVLKEINLLVLARLEPVAVVDAEYNLAEASGALLFKADALPPFELRNWQEGDRLWPAHSRADKKVKELLQEMKVPKAERSHWPVVTAGGTLVWMRGARQREVRVSLQGKSCKVTIESRDER